MLLSIEQLQIRFGQQRDCVVDGLDLQLERGEMLGLVGESGCGKSVTALSIMGLLPQPEGQQVGGRIVFDGQALEPLPRSARGRLRGRQMAMIFQEPMTALNPVHKIGRQISELYRIHSPEMKPLAMRREALGWLQRVGIPAAEQRMEEYPHQLSGGMRQRVMIAMALACRPQLLIADEPTTALDVTIQAQILSLIQSLQQELGMAVLFITHDLGVVAQLCHRVQVMYAGRTAEQGATRGLFRTPAHPYTQALLAAIPTLDTPSKTPLFSLPGQVEWQQTGCRFQSRCQYASPLCLQQPLLQAGTQGGLVACHHPQDKGTPS